jgi:hypothetical protein
VSGLHHVELCPRSLRYYTTGRPQGLCRKQTRWCMAPLRGMANSPRPARSKARVSENLERHQAEQLAWPSRRGHANASRRMARFIGDPNQIAASRESDTLCRTTTSPLPEGTVVDSFFLGIDWTTVAMVIGVLTSVIAAVVYIRPDGR